LSDVEFVAVAHPEHALHRLNRELNFQDPGKPDASGDSRLRPATAPDVGWLGAEQRWTVGSLATAATFVSSGLGFAWLPRHMIERELKEGTLKLLPLDQGGSRNRISTCIRTRTNRWARPRRSSSNCCAPSTPRRWTHLRRP
jgi:DNA-binding transcriptional LysR family regulator